MEAHITEILLTQALQPFSLGAEGKHCSQSPSHSKQRCLDTVLWSHVLPSVVTLERLSFQFSHYIIYKNTPHYDPSTKGTQEHRWRSVLVWEDAELKLSAGWCHQGQYNSTWLPGQGSWRLANIYCHSGRPVLSSLLWDRLHFKPGASTLVLC